MNAIDELIPVIAGLYQHTLFPEEAMRVDSFIRKLIKKRTKKYVVARELPPLAVLQDRYDYDPETGLITYRRDIGKRMKRGAVAGSKNERGYICLHIVEGGKKQRFSAHRTAWALYHEEPPPLDMVVDHKDNEKSNNSITNLRLITGAANTLRINSALHALRSGIADRVPKWKKARHSQEGLQRE